MNDTIKDAVAAAGFRADRVDAVTAYLDTVRREANSLAVQMYVDRCAERIYSGHAGRSQVSEVLSVAFGPTYTTVARGQRRYVSSTTGTEMAAYDMQEIRDNQLGDIKGVIEGNTAWSDDPIPFRFDEPVVGDLTEIDQEILAQDDDVDHDDDDDDDEPEAETVTGCGCAACTRDRG